ncbi:putative Diguanylate cyclase [Burkholderiales bacterium]|nr:putative Diguanylate cyclase [Burkholderiales bacterium]
MNSLIRTAEAPSHRAFPSGPQDVAHALLASDLVAFVLVDSGNIIAASPALREMLGGTPPYHHVDGRTLLSIVAEVDGAGVAAFCDGALQGNGRAEHRCHLMRADGAPLPVLLSAAPVPVEGARQLLIVVTDLSTWVGAAAEADAVLSFTAFDRATGFPTRALLLDRARIALAAARRYRRRAALLRIDMDRLKALLQSLSPEGADEVQSTVAETLRNCVRDCDTTARLGPGEFAILLPEIGQREDAGITAARVVQAIEALFERNEARYRVSAHIGVAVYPTDGTNPERLLNGAELAVHSAKSSKGGGFALAEATSAELTAIKPLEFLDRYRVGIPEIDSEHRNLVDRMNALAHDLKSGADPTTLEYDVRAMVELLRGHFASEASLLAPSPYDGTADVKTRNLRFLEELHCILLHVNSQSIALAIRHLYDFLIPHLVHLDQRRVS